MNDPGRETRGYRRSVGMVVFNDRGEVVVGQRLDFRSDAWQMPQGGIDAGEEPREAAVRELIEEIGTDKIEIVAEMDGWLRYDLPEDLAAKLWNGSYRGQEQKWFAMRFLGTDADIDIHTEHPEFNAWKWLPFAQTPAAIVPFKREVYARLVEEFSGVVVAD